MLTAFVTVEMTAVRISDAFIVRLEMGNTAVRNITVLKLTVFHTPQNAEKRIEQR